MKKTLFFTFIALIFIFISFSFIDDVNAAEIGTFQESAIHNDKAISMTSFYNENLTYINSSNKDLTALYNSYDYYVIISHSWGINSYLFTDYPELVHLVPIKHLDKPYVGVYVQYDSNKPVYMSRNGNTEVLTHDHILNTNNIFFKTNIDNLVFKKIDNYDNLTYSSDYNSIATTFTSSHLANDYSLVYDYYYWDSDMVVMAYDDEKEYSTLYMGTYELESSSTLKLKNMFNSGTNAYGMSKIIWNINASTDLKAIDGIINFKIQYGANDFTNKNIPIFNSYKIYGMNSYESGWTDITNDERFYFDEFNYEYYTLEGTATETVLTSTFNIPSDMCVYEQIKVEFYFDNTNNFYMYVFDDLDDSTWEDMQYYFENYIYYEFPTDKKYAFISHLNNIDNSGRLYVPYNDIINPDSLFGAYIYNYNKRSITKKLLEQEFYDYDYYYYYDFEFSFNNKEVLMLQRKTGTNEKVSFYVPSDYIVEFSNKDNITLLTPDGYVDIDIGKIDNIYRDENVGEVSSFWTTFRNSINYFIEPIAEIFEKITVFFNSLPSEIQYTFYVSFIFIILYYLTKFIL